MKNISKLALILLGTGFSGPTLLAMDEIEDSFSNKKSKIGQMLEKSSYTKEEVEDVVQQQMFELSQVDEQSQSFRGYLLEKEMGGSSNSEEADGEAKRIAVKPKEERRRFVDPSSFLSPEDKELQDLLN